MKSHGLFSRAIVAVIPVFFLLFLIGLSPQFAAAQDASPFQLNSVPTLVGPSPNPTGLDHIFIISTKTLTLSCPANPVATISGTADGSGYVLVDNYITLSVNGNLVTNQTDGGTPFSPAGNVCTGGATDGFPDPNANNTQQDCFSNAYRANVNSLVGLNPDRFANPGNSNIPDGAAGGVPPIDISGFLPLNATSTLVIQAQDAGGFIASSSLYLVTNCTSGSVTQTIPTGGTSNVNLPADFSNPNGTLSTTIDYLAPNGLSFPVPNPVLVTTNTTVPAGTWPEYVVGTPWATSLCTVKAANGSATLCSIFMNACFQSGTDPSTASDANCPTVSNPDDNNLIILEDTFDWGNGKWIPTPGLTASLIAFTVPQTNPGLQWSPSLGQTNAVCPTQTSTTPGPCYLSDTLLDIFGDQTTTRGSKPKSKAWLASAVNVPMLTSSINLTAPNNTVTCPSTLNAPPANSNGFATTIWSNGSCILDFVVSPPPPTNSNFFQAAEPSFLEYGTAQGNVGPPPFIPGALPAGDKTINNPNPVLTCVASVCTATTWTAGPHLPLSTIFGSDGTFTLHWSAKDAAGITEKSITLLDGSNLPCTPDEALSTTCNYFTNYFTTVVNIDSVYPTVSLTFNPTGGVYSAGQNVSATYTCSDTNLASCTAKLDSSPFTSGANIVTTAGNHSITVTGVDLAGNTTAQTFPYQVLADADVAVFEQETSDRVKPGNNLTYIAWALDLSKTDAAEVTLNEQIQLPANGSVHLGNVTASVAVVSCSLSGCTTSMPAGTSCSVSGTSITCNIGTLPSLFKLKGAVVKTAIPVASNSVVGSTFKITATVNSPNDPNPRNNSTTDVITVTSK